MALSERTRMALIGIVGAAAAFFVFRGPGSGPSNPIDAVPKESFLVGTVDAEELRRSPLYAVLLGKEGSPATRALGMKGLTDACGFDPLSRVTRLAVAIPEEGDRGEFGLAARIEVSRGEIENCTAQLAARRGGNVETHTVGSFSVLESVKGSSQPRLGYGGGMLVVGKGSWFDAMLDAADHQKPGISASAEHTALRTAITSREGFRAPTLLVTAILPASLRNRLKKEMSAEVDESDPSSVVMAGVLGVSSVGIAIKAGAAGGTFEADVELTCDTAEACAEVSKLLLKKRLDWSKDLMLRFAGFGPAIDSLEVKQEGSHLRATASANADALAGAIDRALRHRSTEQGGLLRAPQPPMDPGIRPQGGPQNENPTLPVAPKAARPTRTDETIRSDAAPPGSGR